MKELDAIIETLNTLSLDEKIEKLNYIREKLHEASPFRDNPVDLITWIKNDAVRANDYNPNSVAPPEMELLKTSILEDGYTQPIVTWENEKNGSI